ncbi:MAG: flagellar export protein FliJ [Paenibacillaceae bacterium]
MKFRFPLQKIVDLKGNEKTQAEWLLSQALSKLRDEEQFLLELNDEIARQHEQLSRSSETPTPIVDIQFIQGYITHLEKQIERKQAEVQDARVNVQGKQSLLMDRSVDEKVWIKVREKALNLFTATSLKKDQQEMDEMASSRHWTK